MTQIKTARFCSLIQKLSEMLNEARPKSQVKVDRAKVPAVRKFGVKSCA